MEVFADWQLGTTVEQLIGFFTKVALGIYGIAMVIKIVYELFRGLLLNDFRLGFSNFLPIFVIALVIGSYSEIWPRIGDAFFAIGEEIRGGSENTFRYTAPWEAIDRKMGIPAEEGKNSLELIKDWAGYVWGTATGRIQDMLSLGFSLGLQSWALMFRSFMVGFKNIVYALMLMGGPIPLVLSLIPGLGGFAAHWIKNFIVVCFWNVTIAMLDAIMRALNVSLVADVMFNGDEELSISMLTLMSVVMYLFVPYLTSLMIGQTVVAMAGQKMIMQPITTAAILARMGMGVPPMPTKTSVPPVAAATHNAPSDGAAHKAGLITMGNSRNEGVRTAYSSAPSRSRPAPQRTSEYEVTATPVPTTRGQIDSGNTPQRQGGYRRRKQSLSQGNELPPSTSSERLSEERRSKYLLGPKKDK